MSAPGERGRGAGQSPEDGGGPGGPGACPQRGPGAALPLHGAVARREAEAGAGPGVPANPRRAHRPSRAEGAPGRARSEPGTGPSAPGVSGSASSAKRCGGRESRAPAPLPGAAHNEPGTGPGRGVRAAESTRSVPPAAPALKRRHRPRGGCGSVTERSGRPAAAGSLPSVTKTFNENPRRAAAFPPPGAGLGPSPRSERTRRPRPRSSFVAQKSRLRGLPAPAAARTRYRQRRPRGAGNGRAAPGWERAPRAAAARPLSHVAGGARPGRGSSERPGRPRAPGSGSRRVRGPAAPVRHRPLRGGHRRAERGSRS